MKILVCPDTFKGTLTSVEVADIISREFAQKIFTVETIPVGDGGEGTVDSIISALKGKKVFLNVKDPLGRFIDAYYGIKDNIAFIEVAQPCGLTLLKKEELNPLIASTYGFGQMIKDAIERKSEKIYLGLGGSATNDFGIGMLQALGVRFFDKTGEEILIRITEGYGASVLDLVHSFDLTGLRELIKGMRFEVLCDVINPLYGLDGTSRIYSPQKGADVETSEILENNIIKFARTIRDILKIEPNFPGAGAAGGLGSALKVFLNATISPGINGVINLLNIEEKIKNADAVIVGEGKMDFQSGFGKAPIGIARMAKKYKKIVIAINGRTDDSAKVFIGNEIDRIYSCFENEEHNIEYLKAKASAGLKSIALLAANELSENFKTK